MTSASTMPKAARSAVRCGAGRLLCMTQDRHHELVQPRERQPRLGLHAARAQHPHPRRLRAPAGRREQGGFADARLAPHQQRAATLGESVDQPFEPGQLALAAEDRAPAGAVVTIRSVDITLCLFSTSLPTSLQQPVRTFYDTRVAPLAASPNELIVPSAFLLGRKKKSRGPFSRDPA